MTQSLFPPFPASFPTPSSPAPASLPARTALHFLALFAWLAALAGLRPLTAPDEGRYVGVALEMLRSGDIWVPRLDGLPFFHKPPLFYWIGAASMRVFGVHEWAARLPSVLGGTLAAVALLLFLRRWSDGRIALASAVVLVTMPFLYIGAQFANLDMLVAGCITATILAAVHAALLREHGERWRGVLTMAFGLAALGVLAKGLIGVVLPGAVYALWCAATRRWRALRLGAWMPGWIVLLAIAGPWFVAMQLRYPDFFDYFVVTQHFSRFAAKGFNNANPFWFYLPVILGLTLPWSGWLAALAARRWRARRALPSPSPHTDIDVLMGIWLVVIVVFFSLPRSKLVGYVLPALPPLAWFVARALDAAGDARPWHARPAWRWSLATAVVLCLGMLAVAARFAVAPGARLALPTDLRVGPRDEIVMIDRHFYELSFQWNLQRPVRLLGDWRQEASAGGDDWRREIADAARFEPGPAARVLIGPQDLPRLLCDAPATWLVGESPDSLRATGLADDRIVEVARNDRMMVWRFAAGPGCATPPVAPA